MSSFILILIAFLACSSVAHSRVPSSKIFREVFRYRGDFDGTLKENNEFYYDIRAVSTNSPFALCHYTTEESLRTVSLIFVLAIRLEHHLVWEANVGKPVPSNSTVAFGADGNLVLARPDGHIAWQTGTANKGVVDIKLLSNGNLVLLDKLGKFVWQSFDYPTDTLMVDQSLRAQGPSKLVSSNGFYKLEILGENLGLRFMNQLYYEILKFGSTNPIQQVTLINGPAPFEPTLLGLLLITKTKDLSSSPQPLAKPKFNSTFSFLRLGNDGNIKVYSYDQNAQANMDWLIWEEVYTLFKRTVYDFESECNMPEKCGGYGVCENSQCIGCPSPKGPMWWSPNCLSSTKFPTCQNGKTVGVVSYYEVVGVAHFASEYAGLPMRLIECRDKCSRDCKCKGYFYQKNTSKCLLAPQLNTLTKVNASSVAFIKFTK